MDSTRPRALSAAPSSADDQVFDGLSELLWRERALLETLLFRLTVQRRLLGDRELRWSGRADDEVRDALRRVRECEVLRSMESDSIFGALGLSGRSTLAGLATATAEPWSTILHDHRHMLAALTAEIDDAADAIHSMLRVPTTEAPEDERDIDR